MTVPAIEKTWVISHATYPGAGSNEYRGLLYAIVQIMRAAGYVVDRSTNSISAPTDSDQWLAESNLVWDSTTRSWAVFRSPHAAPWYILFDLNYYTSYQNTMSVVVADERFTGGSVSSAPTSPTSRTLSSPTANWAGYQDQSRQFQIHSMVSGSDLRIFACTGGDVAFFLFCEAMGDARGAANPNVVGFSGSASPSVTYALLHDSAARVCVTADGAGESHAVGQAYLTSESIGASVTGAIGRQQAIVDDVDGAWPFPTIGLYSPTQYHIGRRGRLVDAYWANTVNGTGTTAPADNSKAWITMGNLWVPGDGTDWARS